MPSRASGPRGRRERVTPDPTTSGAGPVWCVSIHDAHPRGYLDFDLRDVLAALGPKVTDHWWLMTDLDCIGEAAQPLLRAVEATRGSGVVLSGDELVAAARRIFQTIDATVFAVPPALAAAGDASTRGLTSADVDYDNAPLAIVAVDSTSFDVLTRDERDVRRLRARFRDVRDEDASHCLDS